jgi:hypothetical protein
MVDYTEVIQDGHRADQYPEVGISSGNQALTRCASLGTKSDQGADNFRVARHPEVTANDSAPRIDE